MWLEKDKVIDGSQMEINQGELRATFKHPERIHNLYEKWIDSNSQKGRFGGVLVKKLVGKLYRRYAAKIEKERQQRINEKEGESKEGMIKRRDERGE